MYSTIACGATLHITMPPSEQLDFESSLERNEIDGIMAKMSKVDVEKADAFDPLDKEMIHRAIREKLKNGHADLNAAVKKRLREWTLKQARRVVAEAAEEQRQLKGGGEDRDSTHDDEEGIPRECTAEENGVASLVGLELEPKEQGDVEGPRVRAMVESHEVASSKDKLLRWSRLRLAAARLLREDQLQTEALPILREALKGFERAYGEDHLETLSCANQLGNVLRDLVHQSEVTETKNIFLDEAMSLYERVRVGRTAHLGEESPGTLWAMNNISLCLQIRGDKEEAEEMCRRTYEGRLRILGERHGDTLTSMNNLTFFKFNRGEYRDAVEMFRKAMAISTDAKGANDPWTLLASMNVAYSLWRLASQLSDETQNGDEAPVLLQEAAAIYKRVGDWRAQSFGETHDKVTCCRSWAKLCLDDLVDLSWRLRWPDGTAVRRKAVEWAPSWTSILQPTTALNVATTVPNSFPAKSSDDGGGHKVLHAVVAEPLTAHETLRNSWASSDGSSESHSVVAVVMRGGVKFAQKVANVLRSPNSCSVIGVLVINNDEADPDATMQMAAAPLSEVIVRAKPTNESTLTHKTPPKDTNYWSPVPVAMISFADGSRLLKECRSSEDGRCDLCLELKDGCTL